MHGALSQFYVQNLDSLLGHKNCPSHIQLTCMLIKSNIYVLQPCVKLYGNNRNEEEVGRTSFSIESTFPLNSSLKRKRCVISTIPWCFFLILLHCALHSRTEQESNLSPNFKMGTTMKGIYKGFKYTLSQFFVVKERDIEIGYPTDVKHVAHIGWDGHSGSAPSWMNEFKTGPDFAATSIGHSGSALSPWSSQDFGESMSMSSRQQSGTEMFKDIPPSELPPIKKKQKRKKCKSTSSPKSNSGSTSRSARAAAKSKAKFAEGNANSTDIEVA